MAIYCLFTEMQKMPFTEGMVMIMASVVSVLSFLNLPEVGVEALVGGLVGGMALLHDDLNFGSLFQVCSLLNFILTGIPPMQSPVVMERRLSYYYHIIWFLS